MPWVALLLVLALFTRGGLAQEVPEVAFVESKRSFILSVSMLEQSDVDLKGKVSEDSLDHSNNGLGFSAELNINRGYGLELGIFNIKRRYYTEDQAGTLVEESRFAHVPALFRAWIGNIVSVGLGPFVGIRTEKVRSTSSGDASNLKTQADSPFEYGVESALTLNFAYGDKTGIFLESRWTEPFNQKEGVEINQFTALAGLKVEVEL